MPGLHPIPARKAILGVLLPGSESANLIRSTTADTTCPRFGLPKNVMVLHPCITFQKSDNTAHDGVFLDFVFFRHTECKMWTMTSFLGKFDVPFHEGRIAILNPERNNYSITVECFSLRRSFQFYHEPFEGDPILTLQVGDCIRFSGVVKLKIGNKKKDDSSLTTNMEYIHTPYNGSNKKDWVFFQLTNVKWKRILPLTELWIFRKAQELTTKSVDDWYSMSTDEVRILKESLESAADLAQELHKKRRIQEYEMSAPVISTDLNLDF